MHPTCQANQRAYNLILTERSFGQQPHRYVLLGLERSSGCWNLPGGQRDSGDVTRGATAARELYEESAMLFDKRGNIRYWEGLTSYEYGAHKVFIHEPAALPIQIDRLNKAAQRVLSDPKISRDYKEMERYQLIKLSDLIALADAPNSKGAAGSYFHPKEKTPMVVDGWLLYTLKHAERSSLNGYF